MELRQLRHFVLVAEEGHFGRAARRAGLTQPPISYNISRLETELGVTLFNRDSRQVTLTPSGQALLIYARQALELAERGAAAARSAAEQRRRLRVGYCYQVGYLLGPIVAEFNAEVPDMTVELERMNSIDQAPALAGGKIDIGILQSAMVHDSLEQSIIRRHKYVVALPPEHPLTKKRTLDMADLKDEKFVMLSRVTQIRSTVLSLCRQAGFNPHISEEVGDRQLQCQLVAQGLGVAILPFTEDLQQVAVRPLRHSHTEETLAIAWRPEQRSKELRSFVSIARKHCAQFKS